MNFIKKTWILIALCLFLTSCGADAPAVPAGPPEDPLVETAGEHVSGVIFTYNDKDYDLQERNSMVNALMAETPVGGTIVVEGHIVPNVAYYGIFDTETETFIKDIEGARFSWRDVPMFDALSPERVLVTACNLEYLTDSKGFRQPVYSFTLSDDQDAELRNGSGWSTFVPALSGA